jgi:hypothetical protein
VGVEQKEFGKFDEQSMASIIQGAVDGIMLQWVFDPKAVNLQEASSELSEMFVKRVKK